MEGPLRGRSVPGASLIEEVFPPEASGSTQPFQPDGRGVAGRGRGARTDLFGRPLLPVARGTPERPHSAPIKVKGKGKEIASGSDAAVVGGSTPPGVEQPEDVDASHKRQAKGKGVDVVLPTHDDVAREANVSGEVNVTTADGQRFALRRIPGFDEHGLVLFHEDRKWGAYLRDLTNVLQLEQGVNGAHAILAPTEEEHSRGVRGVLISLSEAPDAKNAIQARELTGDHEDWNIVQAAPTPGGSVAYILAAAPEAVYIRDRLKGTPDARGHLMLHRADSGEDYSIALPRAMEGKLVGVASDVEGRSYILDSHGEMWKSFVADSVETAGEKSRKINAPDAKPDELKLERRVAWDRVDLPLDVTFEKLKTLNNKFVLAIGKNADGANEEWILGRHGWRRYEANEPAVSELVWGKVAEKGRSGHAYLGPFARLREGWNSGQQPSYIKALPKAQRYLAEKGQLATNEVSQAFTRAGQAAKQAALRRINVLPEPARYLANHGVDGAGNVLDAALRTGVQVAPMMLRLYGLKALSTVAMKRVLAGSTMTWLCVPALVGWAWKQRAAFRAPADPITMPGGTPRQAQSRLESTKGYFRRHLAPTPKAVDKHFGEIRDWLAKSEEMKDGNDIRAKVGQPVVEDGHESMSSDGYESMSSDGHESRRSEVRPVVEDGHKALRREVLPTLARNITLSIDNILQELAQEDPERSKAPDQASRQANMPGAFPLDDDEPLPPQFLNSNISKAERFRAADPVEDGSNVLHQLAVQAEALMGNSGDKKAIAAVKKLRDAVAARLVFRADSSGSDDLEAFCAIQLKKMAHDLFVGFDTVRRVNERVGKAGEFATSMERTHRAFVARTVDVTKTLAQEGSEKLRYAYHGPNFEAGRYTTLAKLQADHSPEAAAQYLREVVRQCKSLEPADVQAVISNVVDEHGREVFEQLLLDVRIDAVQATRRLVDHLGLTDEWKRFNEGNHMLAAPPADAKYHRFLDADKARVYSDDNLLYLVHSRHLVTRHGGDLDSPPPAAAPGEPGHELSGEVLHPKYEEFDESTRQLDFLLRRGVMIDATFSAGGFFTPQNDLGVLVGNLLSDQLLVERLAKDIQQKKALAAEAIRLGQEASTGLYTLPNLVRNMALRSHTSINYAKTAGLAIEGDPRGRTGAVATPEHASKVLTEVAVDGRAVGAELHKIDAALQAFNNWSERGISRVEEWKVLCSDYQRRRKNNPIGQMFQRGLVDMTVYRLMSAANRMHDIHSHPDSQMMAAARLNGVIAPEDMDEYGDHMARLMPIGSKLTYKVETHWGADGDGTGLSIRPWSRDFAGAREKPDQPATADTLKIPLNRGPNLQPLYYFGMTKGHRVEVERTKNGFNISFDDFGSYDVKLPGLGLGKFMHGAGDYLRNYIKLRDANGNPELDADGKPKPPSLTALLLDYFGIEGVPGLCKFVPSFNGGLTMELVENEGGTAHHLASKVIGCKLTPTELLEAAVCLKEIQRNGLKLEAEVALQVLQAAVAIMTPNPRNVNGRFKGVVGALFQSMLRGSAAWSSEKSSGSDEVYAKALKLRDALLEAGLDLNTIDVTEIQGSLQWPGVSHLDKQSTEAGRADAARNPQLDPHKAVVGDFIEFEWKVPTGILVEINNVFEKSWKKPEITLDRHGQATSITMYPKVWKDFDDANFPSLRDLRLESAVDYDRLKVGTERAMKAGLPLHISQEMKPEALARYNAEPTEGRKKAIAGDKSNYRLTNVSVPRVREYQDIMFTGFGWLRYRTGATATYTEPTAMLQYPLVWPDDAVSSAASTDSSKSIPKLVRSAPQGLLTESMGDGGFGELTHRLESKPDLENAITSLRTPERLLLTLLDPVYTTQALAERARAHVEDASRQDANADHLAVRGGAVYLRTRDQGNASVWNETQLSPDQLASLLRASPSASHTPVGSPAASTGEAPRDDSTSSTSSRSQPQPGEPTPAGSTGSTDSTGSTGSTGDSGETRESYEDDIHVMLRNERNAQIANRDWAQDILRLMSNGAAQAIPLGVDPVTVLGAELDSVRERASAPSAAVAPAEGFNRPLHIGDILREIEAARPLTYSLDGAQQHVMHTFFPHPTQDYNTELVASIDATDRAIFSDAVLRIAGRVEGAIMARVVVPSRGERAQPTEAGVTHGTQVGGLSSGI